MKKDRIKDISKIIINQKTYSVLLFSFVLMFIFIFIDTCLSLIYLSSHKTLIWKSYNSFDLDGYSSSPWTYFALWLFFELILFLVNLILSFKFLKSKHYNLATFVVGMGLFFLIFSGIILNKTLNI